MPKEFKTLDEQIQILRNRHLVITDEEYAKAYLLSNNYYNIINGYCKYFPHDNKNYTAESTFEELSRLYLFDKEIKQAFFKATLAVESHLKAIFAYRFAEAFPDIPYAYLRSDNYNPDKLLFVIETIHRLSGIIKKYKKFKDNSICHYIEHYNDVPIWVLVNYLDFGDIRYMLANSKANVQNAVARDMLPFIHQHFATTTVFTPEIMLSFIENINDVRNICAHNNRLLGFRCKHENKYWKDLHKRYNIALSDNRASVYDVFLSMQCFLSYTEYAMLHNAVRKLMNNHLKNHMVSISPDKIIQTLGFPAQWYSKVSKIDQQKVPAISPSK